MGYDIADYQDIDRRYGTLDDWEELKDAVHAKGMKLVMDLVVNHTSEEVGHLTWTLIATNSAARLVQGVEEIKGQ